jgi:hypothetical protein
VLHVLGGPPAFGGQAIRIETRVAPSDLRLDRHTSGMRRRCGGDAAACGATTRQQRDSNAIERPNPGDGVPT